MSDETQKPADAVVGDESVEKRQEVPEVTSEAVVDKADKAIIEEAIAEKTEAEKATEPVEAAKTVIDLSDSVQKAVQDAVNEGAPAVEEKPEVVAKPVEEEPVLPKTYYCSSCKSDLPSSIVKKMPLDYAHNPKDGSVTPIKVRFTLLCGKCDGFLRIYDPNYAKVLDKAFEKKDK